MDPCCTPTFNFLFCSATCVFLIHLHAGYHIPQSLEEQAPLQRNTLNLSMDSPTSFGDGVEKMMTSTTGTCILCNHYCWFWFLCSPTYFSVTDFFCNMKMIWTAEIQIFKWRYDHRSGNCNLNNCKYLPPPKKKKMGGLQQDLNPWPLHYSCSTLALILSYEDPYIKWEQTNLLSSS